MLMVDVTAVTNVCVTTKCSGTVVLIGDTVLTPIF